MDYVDRPVWLLKSGDYLDKGFVVTTAELQELATRHNAEPPVEIWNMHAAPVASFGHVDSFSVDGDWLKGVAHLNAIVEPFLITKRVSLGIGLSGLQAPRRVSRINEVSLVDHPRVPGAAIMSEEPADNVVLDCERDMENSVPSTNPVSDFFTQLLAGIKGVPKQEEDAPVEGLDTLKAQVAQMQEELAALKTSDLEKDKTLAAQAIARLNDKYATVPPAVRDNLAKLMAAAEVKLSENETVATVVEAVLDACSKTELFKESLEQKETVTLSEAQISACAQMGKKPEEWEKLVEKYPFLKGVK